MPNIIILLIIPLIILFLQTSLFKKSLSSPSIDNIIESVPEVSSEAEQTSIIPVITPEVTSSIIPQVTPSATPKPHSSLIDCTGPDGVVFKTTQKECDDFNASWASPTPKPRIGAECADFVCNSIENDEERKTCVDKKIACYQHAVDQTKNNPDPEEEVKYQELLQKVRSENQ